MIQFTTVAKKEDFEWLQGSNALVSVNTNFLNSSLIESGEGSNAQ
jgi:hypothetical protein